MMENKMNLIENKCNKLTKSEEVWNNQPSTKEGMLNGFINVHEIDIDNSIYFIETLKKRIGMYDELFEYGLDAGCGIGRVTPILMKYCKKIDLNEPVLKHLKVAMKDNPGFCEAINSRLQEFYPSSEKYDFIWIQWALMFLSDSELIDLLIRIRKSFKKIKDDSNLPNFLGVVCIKENIAFEEDEVDQADNSTTRTLKSFHKIFEKANYRCILEMEQKFLPSCIKPIVTFAITPC